MSKTESQYPILPPLQKRIVLCLAYKGSQTINQLAKNLKSQYKATYIAFQSLENKSIIKKVGQKEYRNRNYPLYWLTDEGLILALIHNAHPDILRENTEQLYGETEAYSLMFEISKVLPSEKLGELYTLFKTTKNGKPELKSILIQNSELETIFRIIMKYPSYRKLLEKAAKSFVKMLKEDGFKAKPLKNTNF
jgi:hypothetical protein